MPTDADRAAFAEAKDICAEQGWELHGWVCDHYGWKKPDSSGCHTLAVHATATDIDATIAVMARGLRDEYGVYIRRLYGTWVLGGCGALGTELDADSDSELAALVAACKEVGK